LFLDLACPRSTVVRYTTLFRSKLPAPTIRREYVLEYGSGSLEMHRDALRPGDRILLVDDVLATGGTARAAVEMIEELGGHLVEVDRKSTRLNSSHVKISYAVFC